MWGMSGRVTRRRWPGFTRGLAVAGRQLSPRPSDASPADAAAAAHGAPVAGRLRSPPYPAAAPASTTARPSVSCQCAVTREDVTSTGRDAAHCPGWPLQPQRCFASRCAGRACGAPLTLETSASPAGLTARARPEARPSKRAANLSWVANQWASAVVQQRSS